MKLTVKRLAQAMVKTAANLPAKDMTHLADAVAQMLASRGQSRMMRLLPPALEAAYLETQGIAAVTMTLPSKDHAKDHADVVKALEHALKKDIQLTTAEDASLIGGARIEVGDERFDFSLATELSSALSHLSSSSH